MLNCFDRKVIYTKENMCVAVQGIYQHNKKRGGISIGVLRDDFDFIFDDLNHEIKVFSPGFIAKIFGSTMEKRIQKAIKKTQKRIDKILKKDRVDDSLEKNQTSTIKEYLDKIPGEKESGLKRATWQAILNKET